MQPTREEWKPVAGFEDTHIVSNTGRVMGPRRKALAQHINNGYPQVTLRVGEHLISRFVHQLVMNSFVGPRPYGMQICHNDGDRTNNALDNLRYDTRLGNSADRLKHAHGWRGVYVKSALMTPERVLAARARHAEGGITITALAEEFGMSRPGMSHIITRRCWYWLD